jgi:hypothetical protein
MGLFLTEIQVITQPFQVKWLIGFSNIIFSQEICISYYLKQNDLKDLAYIYMH